MYELKDGLTSAAVAAMLDDVARHRQGFNLNSITGCYYDQQYYLCHMLAVSRTFTQLTTHSKIFEIIEQVVGPEFRLKALRYYETYGGHHMQWHTDNKTPRGFALIPGIIFIVYISDVEDGEFQYVRGSHKWSGEKAYNDYTDDFVATNYNKDVLSFKGKAGTIIMYDTYGIHRARPVTRSDFIRKSLFWQIDRETANGEPIVINPEFLEEVSPRIAQYLGFGRPANYTRFPQSNIRSLPAEYVPVEDALCLASSIMHARRVPETELLRAIPTVSLKALAKDFTRRKVDTIWGNIPPGAKNLVRTALGRPNRR